MVEQGRDRPELRFKAWKSPAAAYAAVQAPRVPVDQEHDHRWVGELIHLERDRYERLWAVAHVGRVSAAVHVRVAGETVVLEHPLYWSAERRATGDGLVLDSVALTVSPARIAAQAVKLLDGDLHHRRSGNLPPNWTLGRHETELLQRAAVAHNARHKDDPLLIHDVTPEAEHPGGVAVRSAPPVEIRHAEQLDVSTATRTIELIVAPYESPAAVVHQGRVIRELYLRGSFDDVGRRTPRVPANRDHDVRRTVGRAVAFDPHHPRGLVAELKIAETPLGDETLALAAADCLSASAGFRALEERWQGRDTRLIAKGWLDHIAMVPSPAYETADVLAVRGQ